MEKGPLCRAGLHVPPSGRVKKCKNCLFHQARVDGKHLWEDKERSHDVREAGPCTLGVISWPSNCSQDDAVRLWKAACVRQCRGSPAAQGPDMYSGPEKPARCPWTGGAHSLSFTLESLSCGTRCPTLLTLIHPSFCFYSESFPSIPLQQSPIASIAASSHPSVVFLAYPDLFLFFF